MSPQTLCKGQSSVHKFMSIHCVGCKRQFSQLKSHFERDDAIRAKQTIKLTHHLEKMAKQTIKLTHHLEKMAKQTIKHQEKRAKQTINLTHQEKRAKQTIKLTPPGENGKANH